MTSRTLRLTKEALDALALESVTSNGALFAASQVGGPDSEGLYAISVSLPTLDVLERLDDFEVESPQEFSAWIMRITSIGDR